MHKLIWVGMAGLLILSGCAARGVLTDSPSPELQQLVNRQESEAHTFAALVRVKAQRDGKYDDFRVEVFSVAPARISLYLRGFLGQSVLKAVIIGDSLTAYFPRENRFFHGSRRDLDAGQLQQSTHVIDALLALLRGTILLPDTSRWQVDYRQSNSLLRQRAVDREHGFALNARIGIDANHTPPLEPDEAELLSRDNRFRARLDFQSVSFNREIPAAKFALEIPPTATAVSRDEVVELLTGMSQ